MRARYLSELAEGAKVDAPFVLRSREMRTARNGDVYLSVELGDRSGYMPALYFRPCTVALSAPVGTVVDITGTVTSFRGRRRISVESMTPAVTWDAADFLATSLRDAEEMAAEFSAVVRSVGDRSLRTILRRVFATDGLLRRFEECPASDGGNRSYLGGLIEHTLAVVDLCDCAARVRPELERDALITAAVLHDVGLVDALNHRTSISLSTKGRLVGHVALGLMRVDTAARTSGVAESTVLRLEHAILTHHGSTPDAAMGGPSTAEAVVLRRAIQMEEDMQSFTEAVEGAASMEEPWTGPVNAFGRTLCTPSASGDHLESSDLDTGRLTA